MTTVAPPPSRKQILSLFRSFLRSSRQFSDYNIREYTKRRTIDAFHHNKTLTNPSSVAAAFADGNHQLQVAKRQALVYHMYSPEVKSIMEIKC
ncbi:putative complex 1 LYR protein [Helianthus debilis subsp. tardiflorus]